MRTLILYPALRICSLSDSRSLFVSPTLSTSVDLSESPPLALGTPLYRSPDDQPSSSSRCVFHTSVLCELGLKMVSRSSSACCPIFASWALQLISPFLRYVVSSHADRFS